MATRFLRVLVLFLTLGIGSALAQSMWEARGDVYMKQGDIAKAIEAYQTALANDPDNKPLLDKYSAAFLAGMADGSVGTPHVARMGGAEPEPEPGPDAGTDPEAEPGDAEAGVPTTAPVPVERPPAKSPVRVRDDGVVELDFGALAGGGASRMGGSVDEEPATTGPTTYGSSQPVAVGKVRQGYEGAHGEAVEPEDVTIRSAKYEITGVTVAYKRSGNLHISGSITNTSGAPISLPRIYCRIFDEAGVLRGRSFSYLTKGRNIFPKGATREFDIEFQGYRETVASYQFEVVP